MGTAEIYRAVLSLEEIVDALAVDVPRAGGESELLLFVVMREGEELTSEVEAEIARRVVAAMRATKVIAVHADHESANLYFNGPRFVRGHKVEVTMAKGGKLYPKLAG